MKPSLRSAVTIFLILTTLSLSAQKAPAPGELAEAFSIGNIRLIDTLLSRGADPDQPDLRGNTSLIYAVKSGRHDLVERILNSDADPDLTGSDKLTPLMNAVMMSRQDLAVLLLVRGADPDLITDTPGPESRPVSALSLALDRGEFEIAGLLVDEGAEPLLLASPERDVPNPLFLPELNTVLDAKIWRNSATLKARANSLDWDAGAKAGNTDWMLHQAARDNNWRLVRDESDNGRPLNLQDTNGVTPLMTAAWHGNEAIVSFLLQRGADPAINDADGRSALCYAAAGGRSNTVRQLLVYQETGAEASQGILNLETCPLYYAVSGRRHEILDQLLDAGLTPSRVDEEGTTLLMIASWISDTYAVSRLLPVTDGVFGGNPGAAQMDQAGRTALAWNAAAFRRDRRTGREVGDGDRGSRNYPVARLLAGRQRDPQIYSTQPTEDLHRSIVEAWSPGTFADEADDWRSLRPSPVPAIPGDGDLTLHRIFRDEEPGVPAD